ncbi:hypothetical protein C8R45DRAFT_920310 [Mycena sanguinolenta]|nr:hypothetical protein C8R45DRAFT_920310 [Mycena sanguinolenta]
MNSALPTADKSRCTDEFLSRNEHIALANAWWRDSRGEERRTWEEYRAVRGEVGFPRESEQRSGDARLEGRCGGPRGAQEVAKLVSLHFCLVFQGVSDSRPNKLVRVLEVHTLPPLLLLFSPPPSSPFVAIYSPRYRRELRAGQAVTYTAIRVQCYLNLDISLLVPQALYGLPFKSSREGSEVPSSQDHAIAQVQDVFSQAPQALMTFLKASTYSYVLPSPHVSIIKPSPLDNAFMCFLFSGD